MGPCEAEEVRTGIELGLRWGGVGTPSEAEADGLAGYGVQMTKVL